ncbi:MAG: aminotransferase class I/II-fold pyridoxal phosphate-dependent enzyme [Nitrosopumilaceae archaeon]|nr:pyridoxal phosphate-dependent aminotransferase family protein [Nitrosopumilaceae archaeon]NIU02116.1 pyridoxal phosphate-dependent aminotransferase family protein [Nitrosopumilaceae archaeon]NIU88508.1 aminotransferase class I/II-fold pyridoxal phosphate-dependent enzyme [Nitrosopumilaceae archaeon]NIV66750.1 aminotransferase class I/II-fold pyridoxal phosphate-dependent enzyme [Nitrosopumilaceae archaeon]NIX62717.1 aminotransferase class I/II-fold pyridoxal phosphate-dependent enzyme [Nitro
MKPKHQFIVKELEKLQKENLYRQLKNTKVHGPHITIKNKKCLNLCSNDYLGIKSPKISNAQNQSSSRLLAGNDSLFQKFEKKLAHHKNQEDSLIFPTGYMANLGVISSLANKNFHIISDEFNHASIIEACRLSGAKISVYGHNDVDDLMKKSRLETAKKVIVVTEGVFSMDGDFARLKEITEIAAKKDFLTILDDAHGDFVVGNDGKGTANLFGVEGDIDYYISSLSKALGSFGGYVAAASSSVNYFVNKSKAFIYTSALPSFLVKDAIKRFDSSREKRRVRLEKNINQFQKGLNSVGYDIRSKSHIIPIIVGDSKKALDFGNELLNNNIYAQAIRYPTVPKNKARIRLSVTANLTKNQIQYAINVLEKVGKKLGMI